MKVHRLLLDRRAGGLERRHDGRIAVDARNRRWCSDGFEIGCDNGERVRVAFALDCCDREAMSFLATTSGVSGEDVRDLMLAAVEHRFGPVNRLPVTMEWLKPSSAPSSVTMSASVPARMQTPSCTSYRLGSLTTTRFTRTRHSDIVHPVSSSQLTEARDRVRPFGGYNTGKQADHKS